MPASYTERCDSGRLVAIGGVATLVILVFAERRRQARRYGPTSGRPILLGVGMLEVQHLLQADRHVEVLQKKNKAEQEEVEQDVSAGRTPDEDDSVKQR